MHRQASKLSRALAFAAFMAVCGLGASQASAQKNISFSTTGSVASTLVFGNFIVPDVYSFFANPGEQIRLQTSNNGSGADLLDTTIRVIGPDASTNLFDDDGGGNLASRLTFTTTRAGWYVVVVSTFAGNPIGAQDNNGNYVLTIARGAAALAPSLVAEDQKPSEGSTAQPAENPRVEKK